MQHFPLKLFPSKPSHDLDPPTSFPSCLFPFPVAPYLLYLVPLSLPPLLLLGRKGTLWQSTSSEKKNTEKEPRHKWKGKLRRTKGEKGWNTHTNTTRADGLSLAPVVQSAFPPHIPSYLSSFIHSILSQSSHFISISLSLPIHAKPLGAPSCPLES